MEYSPNNLVIRYNHPTRDCRVAFFTGQYKNFGPGNNVASETNTIVTFDKWAITEENGVLVFRDTYTTPGDHRYAFFPGCGNCNNWGNDHAILYDGVHVYYEGKRWIIQEENSVLVFRDKLSHGDNRYAFWPCNYIDP